jgi:hypothetical protein
MLVRISEKTSEFRNRTHKLKVKNMKKFMILFASGISFSSFSQVISTYCTPTMKEIFDFKVGQVFQYNSGCNNCFSTKYYYTDQIITSKYTITSKLQKEDSLIYHIKGLKKTIKISVADVFNPVYDTTINYSQIDQDTVYVDSVNHVLNKCNGDSISYLFGIGKLSITNSDSIKRIDVLNYDGYWPFQVFCINLGLIDAETPVPMMYGSHSWSKLEGYILNGVKVGTISPDNQLILDINLTNRPLDKIIFKSKANNKYEISCNNEINEYIILNMKGQKLIQSEYIHSQNVIVDFNNFPAGLYILKVRSNNNTMFQKVIKSN